MHRANLGSILAQCPPCRAKVPARHPLTRLLPGDLYKSQSAVRLTRIKGDNAIFRARRVCGGRWGGWLRGTHPLRPRLIPEYVVYGIANEDCRDSVALEAKQVN